MYTFCDIPKAIDVSQYNEQTEQAMNHIRKEVPSIVALYSMWEQDLHGLSDIDLLCIIRDSSDEKVGTIKNICKNYSLLDVPYCIDEDSVLLLSYFIQQPYLKHIWWKRYDIPEIHKEAKVLFAWKLCFIGLLRIFYPAFYSKKISVELLLKQIYYIRYLICFLDIDDREILDFMAEYKEFHRTWFDHQDSELLAKKFLPKAIDICWSIIEMIDKKLKQSGVLSIIPKSHIHTWRYPTLFSHRDFRRKSEWYFQKLQKSDRFLCLPHSFNMDNWDKSKMDVLDKILFISPQFLDFWFESVSLKLLLKIKMIKDYFMILYYRYGILWKE